MKRILVILEKYRRFFVLTIASVIYIFTFFSPTYINAQSPPCSGDRYGGCTVPKVGEKDTCGTDCSCESVVPGEPQIGGWCVYSAGGGGGATCRGCWPTPGSLYNIVGTTVTQVSPTSANIRWSVDGPFNCDSHGQILIFVGRSKDVVDRNCGFYDPLSSPTTNSIDTTGNLPLGGIGGGGDGAFFSPSSVGSGVDGTGGGGGGAFGTPNGVGGHGGSGIVVIRYPTGSITAAGGTITFSGGDTIHTFTTSGTLAVAAGSTNNARVLVVGGGAAGGCYWLAGGGGGGGVLQQNNVSLNPGSYPVTVGAGGIGCPLSVARVNDGNDNWSCVQHGTGQGKPGGNSTFGNITATGGGGGGSSFEVCNNDYCKCKATALRNGANGGSGGGAHNFGTSGGSGISGQGNNGGASGAVTGTGGGGGAGQAGQDGQTSVMGGKGGDGIASDISGTNQYYGGGGGGGSGGFLPAGCFKFLSIGTVNRSVTVTGLAPNTTYYFKAVPLYYRLLNKTTGEDESRLCGTVASKPALSCSATINPSSSVIPEGGTGQFTTSVAGTTGTMTVKYSPTNSSYFSFNPSEVTSDVSTGFPTDITGVAQSPPNQQIKADVYANPTDAIPACTGVGTLTVGTPVNAWWQVKDSDVQSDNGLQSLVPTGNYFGLPGLGGYPGVPAYQNSVNFGNGSASQLGWLAESPWSNAKQFDYAFFSNLIPSDTQITTINGGDLTGATPDANGYEWYQYYSPSGIALNIDSPIDIGSRKIILLVKGGGLNINAPINGMTKGSGFFMAIVNGSINVAPTVGGSAGYDLEGLYVADNYFSTGTNGDMTPSDLPLRVRGSIVGYAGVQLQRKINTLESSSTPSEFFEYAPDQMLLYPSVLGYRKINWREVAP